MSVYLQQQAHIRFAQARYDEAYTLYEQLTHTDLRSADIFYAASQCKQRLGDTDAQMALLDSAVNQFSRPYVKTQPPIPSPCSGIDRKYVHTCVRGHHPNEYEQVDERPVGRPHSSTSVL